MNNDEWIHYRSSYIYIIQSKLGCINENYIWLILCFLPRWLTSEALFETRFLESWKETIETKMLVVNN